MIYAILLGLGMAAVIEGLVLALAPLRFEDIAKMISEIPPEMRRWMGLAFAVFGVVLIAVANSLVG
ncbi:MAG: DUF2065 domain-containing protein [Pseudomonadota bacterium]